MGFLRRVWNWFTVAEARYKFDSTFKPIDRMIFEMMHATGRVGRIEALSVPAVLRGRNMICSISTLPLVQHGPDWRKVRLPLLEQIDPDVANSVTLAQTVEDLLFEGISWWRVIARGFDQYPTYARHLDFSSVSLQPPGGTTPAPLPGGYDPRGAVVYVDGEPVPWSDVIRFDSPNPPLLVAGGRAIRRALLLDQMAELYSNNPRPLDYFMPDPNADDLDDNEAQAMLDTWQSARKRNTTAYLPKSLLYNAVDSPTPQEMQLVELQKQVTLEIANALGVDPEDLGVSTTSRTYQNEDARRRAKLNEVLSPYMSAITDRLSMGDVTRRGYRVAFDLDDYLRADPATRAQVQSTYLDKGVTTVDEVRDDERLPPLTAAQRRQLEPAPVVQDNVTPIDAARHYRSATFDKPTNFQFADVPVREFSVDVESRTISGIAMPYGEVGSKYGLNFRFAQGSIEWDDPVRVKLNTHHDILETVGYASRLENVGNELQTQFKVAPGPKGDQALSDADNHILDGMSVGVDFDIEADTVPDPNDKSGILVRRATLRHVALTPEPTFTNARVTKVAASRNGGNQMETCATCGATLTPGVSHTCTTAQAQASVAPDLAAAFAAFMATYQPADNGPTVVNPTRMTASVTEPAPYRFDRRGNLRRGTHEFSSDVFAMMRGDHVAAERVNSFVRAQFDVVTTDVNELNPTRQRPDMYVDQRDFQYPLWDAINKGTLTDVTPFTFPKFSSAGSLVANHTEGVEPSSGTFVTTSATVTPTPVSGKMKLSRETVDQGGNPQVTNLIWRQMTKAWYEALEAFAVSTLDAASPTQIDFSGSPGLSNDDLDQAITSAFADLQFIRGGFSMDNMFTQIDLYKALVAATSADGRRLYPALGPTNANGTVRARYAALDINGVVALPAWALAATGTVAASSYLFDSESVWGWASNPSRIDITQTEVANVYIGLWGYKAAAITDINGVREIVYDPS